MSIFKRGTPQDKRIVSDAGKTVSDFCCRAPFWAYRPVDYLDYPPFMQYQVELDKHLAKLFEGGVNSQESSPIDSGNGNCLDNLIFDMSMLAYDDYLNQQSNHRDGIRNLSNRFHSDELHFRKELARLQEDLLKIEAAQIIIKSRLEAHKYSIRNKEVSHV